MHRKSRTREGDRLEARVTLVEAYEARHYPLGFPNLFVVTKCAMESQGLSVKDFESVIGRSDRAY